MITGFLNLWKPAGGSSARLVAEVKRLTGEPTGHMGTLDPMAEGVLPVCLGRAGRLFDYLLDKEKVYVAEFTFGYETDTLDRAGRIERRTDAVPGEAEIAAALPSLTGEIEQVPPKYSAKSVNGVRGYRLARQGAEFSLPAKKVTVLSFTPLGGCGENAWRFEIRAKGGTYIRSLCRDLAYACGSLGTMTALTRTASGIFDAKNALTPAELSAGGWREKLIPADCAVNFPRTELSDTQAKRLLDGKREETDLAPGYYRAYAPGEFFGIGESADGAFRMRTYLRTEIYGDL